MTSLLVCVFTWFITQLLAMLTFIHLCYDVYPDSFVVILSLF